MTSEQIFRRWINMTIIFIQFIHATEMQTVVVNMSVKRMETTQNVNAMKDMNFFLTKRAARRVSALNHYYSQCYQCGHQNNMLTINSNMSWPCRLLRT